MTTNARLNGRFKAFALAIIRLTHQFPNRADYRTVQEQMIDSACSSAANYRAAARGKSTADFINKLKIAEEELDETLFWLEMTVGLSEQWRSDVVPLYKEANELLSITVSAIKTSRQNKNPPNKSRHP